jgi:hypothetical protein
MTGPDATGRRPAAGRLAGIGLLAAGVAVALYVAGRLHTPDYSFSLFGRVGLSAVMLRSTLASIALGAAALHVLLAPWIYRKPPLAASPPRPVPLVHRIIGFALFALTVPGRSLGHRRIAGEHDLQVHGVSGRAAERPRSPIRTRSCSWQTSTPLNRPIVTRLESGQIGVDWPVKRRYPGAGGRTNLRLAG